MAVDYIASAAKDGLAIKLYRGEDMVLLAFDIDAALRKPDFMGFGIQYKVDGADWRDVFNFLTFKQQRLALKAAKPSNNATEVQQKAFRRLSAQTMASWRSPIQMFRWAHVPSIPIDGPITYKIGAMFWRGDGQPPVAKATVEASIRVDRATRGDFLNIGFTRGFAGSQAYERNFPGQRNIIPKSGKPEVNFDTAPYEGAGKPYPWLGFEARKILFGFMEECAADPKVHVDVFAYDFSNPEIIRRLAAFGNRLRIVIDTSGKHDDPGCDENVAAAQLTAAGAAVARHEFSKLQHNKVIVAKRKIGPGASAPFAVLTGSTNFSLGGIYIQNNNVLLFRDAGIAKFYADVFDAAFPQPTGFSGQPIAQQWFEKVYDNQIYRFCFSPHKKAELSMKRVADAVTSAEKSVFYALAFRGAQTGPADLALDELDTKKLTVMGVADKPGKPKSQTVMVQLTGRGAVPYGPAALEKNLPEPFVSEWKGGGGARMHHKFVVCDFNGANPVVFTGSSNMAAGGEEGNGDNLIEIRDPKVVVAYAVQVVSIFDHYGYRCRMKEGETDRKVLDLAEPPVDDKPAWWASSFKAGDYKCRDRELFIG